MPAKRSEDVMRCIDAMTPAQRALVYEYGFVIVLSMINEGYNANQLKPLLRQWRKQQQEKLLNA